MLRLTVDGMNCNPCVQSVTKAVKAVDPQAVVRVDLAGKTVEADTSADHDTIAKAIAAAGYAVAA
jgi:copper chaperone